MLISTFFQWKSANFAISRNANINCILVHNFTFFQTIFEYLKIVLINMVTIWMMLAKMATLCLVKKGYNVIIFVHDVTNKILSGISNYIADLVM